MAMTDGNVNFLVKELDNVMYWLYVNKDQGAKPTIEQHFKIVNALREVNQLVLDMDIDHGFQEVETEDDSQNEKAIDPTKSTDPSLYIHIDVNDLSPQQLKLLGHRSRGEIFKLKKPESDPYDSAMEIVKK